MALRIVFAFLVFALGGCAEQRIVSDSHSYYRKLSALSRQEVIDNIDEMIGYEYSIPSRTTFGKGNLTITDAGTGSAAIPFHILSTNAGTATATVGSVSDAYQIALVPEVDGSALSALRQAYLAAVFGDKPENAAIAKTLAAVLRTDDTRWLYWIGKDGRGPYNGPPPNSVMIGEGINYLIYTTKPEIYTRFVLLTYGSTAAKDRAIAGASPVSNAFPMTPAMPGTKNMPAPPVPPTPPQRPGAPVRQGRPSPRPAHFGGGFNIPPGMAPAILMEKTTNFPAFLGGKASSGGTNDPIAPIPGVR